MVSVEKMDPLASSIEEKLRTSKTGGVSGVADEDLVWVPADQEGILFGMNGFTEVGPLRRISSRTCFVTTVLLTTSYSVVPCADDPVKAINQYTTHLQLPTGGPRSKDDTNT